MTIADFSEYTIANASAPTVTVYKDTRTPETQPDAAIDYVNERLTGLTASAAYNIDSTDIYADSNGYYSISSLITSSAVPLTIIKKGNGTTTTDSAAQSLSIPARPAAPSLTTTGETKDGLNDGKINSITTAMEHNTTSATHSTWTTYDGTNAFAPGTYYVRVKAVSGASGNFVGEVTSGLTISAGAANAAVSPTTKTFTEAAYGYGTQTEQTFTITNYGTMNLTSVL